LKLDVTEARAGCARSVGPGRAGIGGTQDAIAGCRQDHIAVGGRDENPPDGIGRLGGRIGLRPVDASIGRLHDAESIGVEGIVITGRRVEDVAVVVVDGDVRESDGGDLIGLIRIQEVPVGSGVRGLPDAATGCAAEVNIGVVRVDADLVDPPHSTGIGIRTFRGTGHRSKRLPDRGTHRSRRRGRSRGINTP